MSETTKRCPRCGAALPEAAAFCPYCTADLRRRTAAVPPPVLPSWVLRSLAAALLILTADNPAYADRPMDGGGVPCGRALPLSKHGFTGDIFII